jgi:Flp pilus assembly protein TadB
MPFSPRYRLGPTMAWQLYRPRSPADEAAHTLTDYQLRLRAAESSDKLEVNLDTQPPAVSRAHPKRLRIACLWAILVLAVAGAATWFLDRVLAIEVVTVFTLLVIFSTAPRVARISGRDRAP